MDTVDKDTGIVSRRTFLKLCVQIPALLAGLKVQRGIATKPSQPFVPVAAYGTGLYGQGSYPGYRVNLPLIVQE